MTPHGLKPIAIFLKVLVISSVYVRSENTEGQSCEFKPNPRYPSCMLSNDGSTLWCDNSGYVRILQPNEHSSVKAEEAEKITTLFINDSCLLTMSKGDIVNYTRLKSFNAMDNFIKRLCSPLFSGNTGLEEIDLSRNEISEICSSAFSGLNHLVYLNLNENFLEEISFPIFLPLTSLEVLSLSGNRIDFLEDFTFIRLKSLKSLDLSGNTIRHIEDDAFKGLQDLKKLNLSNNKIQEISERVFRNMSSLEVLIVSSNNIGAWPDAYGATLTNLRTLDLGANSIQKFTGKHVNSMFQLRRLELGGNSLEEIQGDQFSSLTKLNFLNLSANYIDDIPAESFSPLGQLQTLLLRGNRLSDPRKRWLDHLSKNGTVLTEIDLRDNPWNCGCEVLEFHNFVESLKLDKAALVKVQIICKKPKWTRDQPLHHVIHDVQHDCSNPKQTKTHAPSRGRITLLTSSTLGQTTKPTKNSLVTALLLPVHKGPESNFVSPNPAESDHDFNINSTLVAVILGLTSVIVILIIFVYFRCRLKRSPIKEAKANSKHLRNDSTEPCLQGEGDIGDPAALREPFDNENNDNIDMVTEKLRPAPRQNPPTQRNSRREAVQGSRDSERFFTPTTIPKRLYTQVVPSLQSAPNHQAARPKTTKLDSIDLFHSCEDLSLNHLLPSGNDLDCGPPSSFNFYSIISRQEGDGAELSITS